MAISTPFYKQYLNNFDSTYGTVASAPKRSMAEMVNSFSKHYECKVQQTQKQYARYDRPIDYFVDPRRADVMSRSSSISYSAVPVVEVSMPLDRFEALIDIDDKFRQGRQFDPARFEEILEKERREAMIRHANPAVKKAYENYSMLLNLVKDEYK